MKSRGPTRVMAVVVCAASLVASAAQAAQPADAPEASQPPARADAPAKADVPSAAAPASDERPPSRYSAEVSGGQTRPSPSSSSTSFLYQRAVGHYSPTASLELGATFRANEDFASRRAAGSTFNSSGDAIFYGAIDGTYLLTPHVDVSLGINGSPSSKRDVATSLQVSNGGTGRTVDALVQARSSSVGATATVGYDSFEEDAPHDVDVALDGNVAVTRFSTDQAVVATDGQAPNVAAATAALSQARLGTTMTFTLLEHTDLGVDGAYFLYDSKDPANVGLFDATSSGVTTSFGAGIPTVPARWTIQPDVSHRFGRLSVRAYYQYADLTADSAVAHTFGGKVQIAAGPLKLYATASVRSDVYTDATAETWVAGLGVTGKL